MSILLFIKKFFLCFKKADKIFVNKQFTQVHSNS